MRRYVLVRHRDVSGVSGLGAVAEIVEYSDGVCAMRWRGRKRSTVVHDSLSNIIDIHGHGDSSEVVAVDEEGLDLEAVRGTKTLEEARRVLRDD